MKVVISWFNWRLLSTFLLWLRFFRNELSPVSASKSEICCLGSKGPSIYQLDCFFWAEGKKEEEIIHAFINWIPLDNLSRDRQHERKEGNRKWIPDNTNSINPPHTNVPFSTFTSNNKWTSLSQTKRSTQQTLQIEFNSHFTSSPIQLKIDALIKSEFRCKFISDTSAPHFRQNSTFESERSLRRSFQFFRHGGHVNWNISFDSSLPSWSWLELGLELELGR